MEVGYKDIKGAIRSLNLSNERIIEIEGEYFVVSVWDQAENSVQKHHLEGKDITGILAKYAGNQSLTPMTIESIKSEIIALERVIREYHKDTRWRLFDISIKTF